MNELDMFIDSLNNKEKSESTISAYQRDIVQMLNHYNIKSVKYIKQEILEDYKNYLMFKRMLSPKTVNRKIIAINEYLSFYNITYSLKQIKIHEQNFLDNVISIDETNELIKIAEKNNDYRAKALFSTLAYTGMRISECLQIKVEDIYKDTITIVGKGKKIRDIFIPDKLKDIWLEYCRYRINKSDKLFTGQKGAINRHTAYRILKKYADICGIDKETSHPHSFRHMYCKNLATKNVNIETIADLAGHTNINITRIYLKKSKEELLKTINDIL